jgi:hypothetical protein
MTRSVIINLVTRSVTGHFQFQCFRQVHGPFVSAMRKFPKSGGRPPAGEPAALSYAAGLFIWPCGGDG